MTCGLSPSTCRRNHIAPQLKNAEADGGDYEAPCPACGHGGFRISQPTRSRSYRHIWTCACRRCKCSPGVVRVALLKLDIDMGCLGLYCGNSPTAVQPEAARRMDRVISDILAAPHLKSADVRLALAEAQGRVIPEEYREFVRFAKDIGISQQQAYEAARRWVGRPSDCPPLTGGGVVDTSRSTAPGSDVKPRSSQPRDLTEKVRQPYRKSEEQAACDPEAFTEKVNRTLDDNKNRRPAA